MSILDPLVSGWNAMLAWTPPNRQWAIALAIADGLINVLGYVCTKHGSNSASEVGRTVMLFACIAVYAPAMATVFYFTKVLDFRTGAMITVTTYVVGIYLCGQLLDGREFSPVTFAVVCTFMACGGWIVSQSA